MNYLQRKKLAFMSIVNQIKGFVRTMVGLPPLVLPDCVDGTNLINYTISGNSVQDGTPTPDNPVEIESVGEKSKNLLKIAGRTEGVLTGQGATTVRDFDFNKYYVDFTRTNVYSSGQVTYCSVAGNTVEVETNMAYVGVALPVKVKPNTNYYLSNLNNEIIGVGFYTLGGQYIEAVVGRSFKFTTPENCEIITVVCGPQYTKTLMTFENIQLEEGTSATDYEPYGYKIPITVRGKNLVKIAGRKPGAPSDTASSNTTKRTFDFNTYVVGIHGANWYVPTNIGNNFSINEDNSVTLKSTNVGYGIGFPIPLKPNTTYFTPVCDDNHNYNNIGIAIYKSDGTFSRNTSCGIYIKFTTEEDETIGVVMVKATTSNVEDTISNIFMEECINDNPDRSDYEPYQEPTETAIYLDEPLRKVGDYADYIDFENGKVVRNIKTQYLDPNYTSITKYTWVNKVGVYFGLYLDNVYERIPGLSNRNAEFAVNPQATTSMWLGTTNKNFFWIGILDYLGFVDDDTSTAIDKFRVWIANNPTYIYYHTSTPIEELIKLPNIPLNKGTTILSIGTIVQPSNISATYYSTSKE